MADDGVDLDTITALESRITAALDRIGAASAVMAIGGRDRGPDPALAEERAKVGELKAALSAAEGARDALQSELDDLRAAPPGAAAGEAAGDQAQKLELLQQRVARLREERNAIREERDQMAEELDELRLAAGSQSAAPEAPADAPEALLETLKALRRANADLRQECEAMRQAAVQGDGAPDAGTLNAAMAAELLSLRAERAADAAEMETILAEMRPLVEGDAHA